MSAIETTNASGRSDREGVNLSQLLAMFPTEKSAERWFVNVSGRTLGVHPYHCFE